MGGVNVLRGGCDLVTHDRNPATGTCVRCGDRPAAPAWRWEELERRPGFRVWATTPAERRWAVLQPESGAGLVWVEVSWTEPGRALRQSAGAFYGDRALEDAIESARLAGKRNRRSSGLT